MMRRTHPGSQILLTLGMAVVLAGCAGEAAPPGPEADRGATGRASVTTAPSTPALVPQAQAGPGEVTVTVFHETHMHGALLGEDRQSSAGVVPADGRTFAQYAGLLDQQRRRLQPGSSLFVGNGDDLSDELPIPAVFGGGPGVQTHSRHVADAFNAAGMDADTFGCDYVQEGGPHLLRGLVTRSRFRWVSANVRDGSSPSEVFAAEQGAQLFTLFQVGGVPVGVTGAASSECGQTTPGVTLLDPVTALLEVVPQMHAAGARVVVLLSHLTYEEMEQVAEQVDGVDVIVGSHVGPQPTGYLDEPRIVGETILSVAGNDMAAVGQIDLVVGRSDGRVIRFGFRRHVVTPGGPTSAAVEAVLDGYLMERP